MTVDVFSDITCPFCYIGKRHLEGALAELGISDAEIRFRSFVLDPTVADSDLGTPSTENLAAKKGITEGVLKKNVRTPLDKVEL